MDSFWKMLIGIGAILMGVGLVMLLGNKIGLGKLPGDLFIERGNFKFFFPITTSIILSILLSFILRFFRR